MMNLSGIVDQLKKERDSVEKQLSALNAALTAFVGAYSGAANSKGTRTMSAAARKRISLAQKARWATSRSMSTNQTGSAMPKRIVSASARRKMAAAQRARWARVKAGKKAA